MRKKKTYHKIISSLFSLKLSLLLMTIIATILATATIIEKQYSTLIAQTYIYHHPILISLLAITSINMIGALVTNGYTHKTKIGMCILHFAFLCILAGATITHIWGYEGILHLRVNEKSNKIIQRVHNRLDEQLNIRTIPFHVTLNEFKLERYPGSQSPSSYDSKLTINTPTKQRKETLSVNKVIHQQGFRLYQSSYDPDEKGTIITVNFDPYGTIITYIGYLLLAIGIVGILLGKGSRFRTLLKKLDQISTKQNTLILLILFGSLATANASELPQNAPQHAPSTQVAAAFGRLLIQSPSGRIEPMNSYSKQILRKIARQNDYEGLNSDQILLGLILYPQYWENTPIISQTNQQIHSLLNTSGKQISYSSLFDRQGTYKLEKQVQMAYSKESKMRNRFEKELLKLDEKANLYFAIRQGEYLRIFPLEGDKDKRWYSPGDNLSKFSGRDSLFVSRIFDWLLVELHNLRDNNQQKQALEVIEMIHTYQQKKGGESLINPQKLEWEIRYNQWQIFDRLSMIYLTISLILIFITTLQWVRPKKKNKHIINGLTTAIALCWIAHTLGLALRWYCSGQTIGSNAYETMTLLAWATIMGGLLFWKKSSYVVALSTLLSGFTLLVAHLNFMDPEITPLVPVLKSGWLMIHVASIMSSYGMFGISFLIGILSIILISIDQNDRLTTQIHTLRLINELSITIGLCLLTIGTFLGAIWANESWGRYWGWDPKETWALITMIVYALVLHARFITTLRSDFAFSSMTILALSSVLMTYFGVNLFLSGLHAYGNTEAPPALYLIYICFTLLAIAIITIGWRRNKKTS